MEAQAIFDKLWKDYSEQNPSAEKVHDLFVAQGETVENDHIAFRTLDDPRVNIDVLAKPFIKSGYEEKGNYIFENKHLLAKHFEHKSDGSMPRVFISQLITGDFSDFLQETVQSILDQIPSEKLQSDELIHSGRLWEQPSYQTYQKLREESEYAAWLYVYGFRANHFTVSINALKKFNDIRQVNRFLKDHGFLMNDSGGEVKGTPKELLEQSSIKSEHINVDFQEGIFEIPACYYEFAKRYEDENGKLYPGFIAKSADKIFESTNYYNKK